MGSINDENAQMYKYILEIAETIRITINTELDIKQQIKIILQKINFYFTGLLLEQKIPADTDFIIIDFYLLPYLAEFCEIDFSIFIDTPTSLRHEYALNRIMNNKGNTLDKKEQNKTLEDMKLFDQTIKVDYTSFSYDYVFTNDKNKEVLIIEAKKVAIKLLRNYSSDDIKKILAKEIKGAINDSTMTNDLLLVKILEKIKFLYTETLINDSTYKELINVCKNVLKCNNLGKKTTIF